MTGIASISYGKDSLAMLEAIKILGLPLDRIVTAEVWATDTIPADLPPMEEFKEKADRIILERYGIVVEHYSAQKKIVGGCKSEPTKTLSMTKLVGGQQSVDSRLPVGHGATADSRPASLTNWQKVTYQDLFYRVNPKKNHIYGFPMNRGQWCNSELKMAALNQIKKARLPKVRWCSI